MKFGKNLQRVAEISDPSWAPYWVNYKELKKLIKSIPPVPSKPRDASTAGPNFASVGEVSRQRLVSDDTERLKRDPGEIAFFRLLHEELRKGARFFDKILEEFSIREERLKQGMNIVKRPESFLMTAKWSVLAKSIFRLYKDLLLLETYAIMTFYAFSKILKKHDKVTGHETKGAFMSTVVSSANFATYPSLMDMINTCETLYNEVSEKLVQEGTQNLHEDERLFISMLSNMNSNVPPRSSELQTARVEFSVREAVSSKEGTDGSIAIPTASHLENWKTDSLRTLVEENECDSKKRKADDDSYSSVDDQKPRAQALKRRKE